MCRLPAIYIYFNSALLISDQPLRCEVTITTPFCCDHLLMIIGITKQLIDFGLALIGSGPDATSKDGQSVIKC